MKKAYIAPTVMAIKIDTTSILAASMGIDQSGTEIDTGTEQGGRDTRPSNPNLWDQLW
ncbi:MAG: hypothetical protein NC113_07600 [Bacteroides sp.]|nr:hypothetical protein [Bacteroides sp.]MCM1448068.1 hypothetical protein [Bacteroides sp.]